MKHFLLGVLFVAGNFCAQSQTKGTDAIGFGIGVGSQEANYTDGPQFKQNSQMYSLTYGHFFRDNHKISVKGLYQKYKYNVNEIRLEAESYGTGLNYVKYFAVIPKLFVYAGGGLEYQFGEEINTYFDSSVSSQPSVYKYKDYALNASGGVAYFLSKRIAFESQLLGANARYRVSKNSGNVSQSSQKSFNFSSSGNVTDLNFQIYFLF